MGNARTVYDISLTLGEETFAYPGDTLYSREVLMNIENGGFYNLSKVVMSAHSGTHIDIPFHFIPGTKTVEQFAVQNFIRPAHVVLIEDKEAIRPREFEKLDINRVMRFCSKHGIPRPDDAEADLSQKNMFISRKRLPNAV